MPGYKEADLRPSDPRVAEARTAPPAWDRTQDVRVPQTIEEARASLALVQMKIDALGEAGDRNPEKRAKYDSAIGTWEETEIKLTWALRVLEAGESPTLLRLREVESLYVELAQTVSKDKDVQKLILALQIRERNADAARDMYRLGEASSEFALDAALRKREELEHVLVSRNDEIKKLKDQIRELQQEKRK